TAYAAQSSLPGDTLYSVKLGTEQLQRMIIFDDATEVELELKFASTRLDELEEIAIMPPDQIAMTIDSYDNVLAMSIIDIPVNEPRETYTTQSEWITIAVAGYKRNLNLAITKAENVTDGGTLTEKIALAIINHLDRLDEIEDKAFDDAQETIVDTKGIAINGHIRTLQNLATVNPVRATEINLQAIQGRLGRANIEAAKSNSRGMEDTLQEYEKLRRFGEGISNSTETKGQGTIPIDELNAQATTEHMESLGSIYGNAPKDMKDAVEQAIDVAIETHKQAVQGLRQQDAQGDIPTEPPIPNNIPENVKENIQGSH
ncbi:DUF5667 domain-containing protein, partial [Chloroflexota bacterium]